MRERGGGEGGMAAAACVVVGACWEYGELAGHQGVGWNGYKQSAATMCEALWSAGLWSAARLPSRRYPSKQQQQQEQEQPNAARRLASLPLSNQQRHHHRHRDHQRALSARSPADLLHDRRDERAPGVLLLEALELRQHGLKGAAEGGVCVCIAERFVWERGSKALA